MMVSNTDQERSKKLALQMLADDAKINPNEERSVIYERNGVSFPF